MKINDIKDLLKFITKLEIEEINIETKSINIKIKKNKKDHVISKEINKKDHVISKEINKKDHVISKEINKKDHVISEKIKLKNIKDKNNYIEIK